MATALHRTAIFFPVAPRDGSPYAGKSWEEIRTFLQLCLRQAPDLVQGYTIGEGEGHWYEIESKLWANDECRVVEIYTSPGFAGEHRDARTAAARFLASLSYLSCVFMGHDLFFSVVQNQRCLGNKHGLFIGPDEQLIPYDAILTSGSWMQSPLQAIGNYDPAP